MFAFGVRRFETANIKEVQNTLSDVLMSRSDTGETRILVGRNGTVAN